MQLETPSNILFIGRNMPLLRRFIQGLADNHENGIVVTTRPTEFYQMVPKLHIQNCFRPGFVRNLYAVRRGAQQRRDGLMYVVWDEVLDGVAADPILRSILAQNQKLGLTNVVVSERSESWMMPQFDRAIVSSGITSLGVSVPEGSYAAVALTDLRYPCCHILPLDQENATV
jgi:hypothetical protein